MAAILNIKKNIIAIVAVTYLVIIIIVRFGTYCFHEIAAVEISTDLPTVTFNIFCSKNGFTYNCSYNNNYLLDIFCFVL